MTPHEEERFDQLQEEALLAWARQRDNAATLGNAIKKLIVQKIGTLTAEEMKYLSLHHTLIPFNLPPIAFVDVRADKMFLTEEERADLAALDLSDHAETDMGIWAMTDIIAWLESQPDGKQKYAALLSVYQEAITDATRQYVLNNGHLPIAIKAINMVMTLARARKYINAYDKGKGK